MLFQPTLSEAYRRVLDESGGNSKEFLDAIYLAMAQNWIEVMEKAINAIAYCASQCRSYVDVPE